MKTSYMEPAGSTESKWRAYEDLRLILLNSGETCWKSRFSRPLLMQEQRERSNFDYVKWMSEDVYARPSCIANSALLYHLSIGQDWIEWNTEIRTKDIQENYCFALLAHWVNLSLPQFKSEQHASDDDDICELVRDKFLQFEEVQAIFYGKYLDENQFTVLADSSKYSEDIYDRLIEAELNILDKFEGRPILINFIWAEENEVSFSLAKGSVTLARRTRNA